MFWTPASAGVTIQETFYEIIKLDELVKSRKSRHSRVGGSPELFDLTGFPLSRE
jgi:hypothetical protein